MCEENWKSSELLGSTLEIDYELFERLGERLPTTLRETRKALEERLDKKA